MSKTSEVGSQLDDATMVQESQIDELAGDSGDNNGEVGSGVADNEGERAEAGAAKKDEEEVDPKLLEDVPAWLRSLRLHKYTPNFEGMNWKDMVVMDEAALEAKGVAALGARRKMLKTFEIVRKKMGIDAPASAALSATSS